jgi:DNA-binding response OmpR family regulator
MTAGPSRVLVIENEPDFLPTYDRLLRRHGYDVVAATTRSAGLLALAREQPRLVICDLRLPDGDGLDVVRAARAMASPAPVMVVTGHASGETRRAALAAGAATFVAKPFAAATLLAQIRSVLAGPADPRPPEV